MSALAPIYSGPPEDIAAILRAGSAWEAATPARHTNHRRAPHERQRLGRHHSSSGLRPEVALRTWHQHQARGQFSPGQRRLTARYSGRAALATELDIVGCPGFCMDTPTKRWRRSYGRFDRKL